jgi:Domain of unknown function (DUF4136)
MMKTKFALCVLMLCSTVAVAVGQTVSVDFNKSESFSQFHTYAWGSDNANQVKDSILAQVAIQNIDTALQAKGLKKVGESEKPDLLVTANGGLKEQTSYTAMGMRGWGGGSASITQQQNVVGTLIVDLYNAKGKTLVWRGLAENTLNSNGDKNQQMVQKAVTKMFEKWPKS